MVIQKVVSLGNFVVGLGKHLALLRHFRTDRVAIPRGSGPKVLRVLHSHLLGETFGRAFASLTTCALVHDVLDLVYG